MYSESNRTIESNYLECVELSDFSNFYVIRHAKIANNCKLEREETYITVKDNHKYILSENYSVEVDYILSLYNITRSNLVNNLNQNNNERSI